MKYRKWPVVVALLFVSAGAYAQNYTMSQLSGNWFCDSVSVSKQGDKKVTVEEETKSVMTVKGDYHSDSAIFFTFTFGNVKGEPVEITLVAKVSSDSMNRLDGNKLYSRLDKSKLLEIWPADPKTHKIVRARFTGETAKLSYSLKKRINDSLLDSLDERQGKEIFVTITKFNAKELETVYDEGDNKIDHITCRRDSHFLKGYPW